VVVVLAYAHDTAARGLVARWRAAGVAAELMTCADLSRPGWRYLAGDPSAGRININGLVMPSAAIDAVVTRMPAVGEAELAHVHEEDRAYAASEMQAFLLAWLSALECPVLNRPSPANLAGPAWSRPEWARLARQIGLGARAVRHRAVYVPGAPQADTRFDPTLVPVDVVGERAFLAGGREPRGDESHVAQAALALARIAGVDIVRVHFEPQAEPGPVFVEVSFWVDVAAEPVGAAVLDRCRNGAQVGAAPDGQPIAPGMATT